MDKLGQLLKKMIKIQVKLPSPLSQIAGSQDTMFNALLVESGRFPNNQPSPAKRLSQFLINSKRKYMTRGILLIITRYMFMKSFPTPSAGGTNTITISFKKSNIFKDSPKGILHPWPAIAFETYIKPTWEWTRYRDYSFIKMKVKLVKYLSSSPTSHEVPHNWYIITN